MRALLIAKLYKWTKPIYQFIFKRHAGSWDMTLVELALFPEKSLGYDLYCFLTKYQFSLISKAENHDVTHVITQIGVSPLSEVKMQYLLLGNGKRSPYLFICLFAGLLFYPSHVKHFYTAYARGKKAMPFYRIDFKNCLHMSVDEIRKSLNIN